MQHQLVLDLQRWVLGVLLVVQQEEVQQEEGEEVDQMHLVEGLVPEMSWVVGMAVVGGEMVGPRTEEEGLVEAEDSVVTPRGNSIEENGCSYLSCTCTPYRSEMCTNVDCLRRECGNDRCLPS